MESHFMVTIYLYGDDLDPAYVSEQLGVVATRSHSKGKRVTSTNREFFSRTGMWSLEASATSNILADHVDELMDKIKLRGEAIQKIKDVEQTKLDVYIDKYRKEDALMKTYELELSERDILSLSTLGLPVCFTLAVIDD